MIDFLLMTSGISVLTSQRTDSIYIRKTKRLMLFREMIHKVKIIRNTQIHCVGKMEISC